MEGEKVDPGHGHREHPGPGTNPVRDQSLHSIPSSLKQSRSPAPCVESPGGVHRGAGEGEGLLALPKVVGVPVGGEQDGQGQPHLLVFQVITVIIGLCQ